MARTLIDSNVLIDLFDGRSEWQSWSESMAAACRNRGPIWKFLAARTFLLYRHVGGELRIVSP